MSANSSPSSHPMALPLPLLRRGKVREVYDLGENLLIVASNRISAFEGVRERYVDLAARFGVPV